MTAPWLGVIADDVTGACDVAGGIAETGVRTSIVLGVPEGADDPAGGPDECIVVGLKIRTVPAAEAVGAARAAAAWLRGRGTGQIYQKYCSTFDSTDSGNIGPIADALAESIGGMTLGTPATPAVRRTQYFGHLFVGDRLLSESPMRDHPLTPMRDSDLVAVLGRQTAGAVALLPLTVVRSAPGSIADGIRARLAAGARHLLVDAIEDSDLDRVAEALEQVRTPLVLGGGAGLAVALARRAARGPAAGAAGEVPHGGRLILSGSGSARTREQVAAFPGRVMTLDPLRIAEEGVSSLLQALREALAAAPGESPLVSATAEPDRVREVQATLGVQRAAELVESALGEIAVAAVRELGVRRIVVAGGETSGATVAALGMRRLSVGAIAAPGVPWTTGSASAVPGAPTVALLLKSGNFGSPDLFTTAWETAP
ncbi:MAG: hypothetical protein JWR33_1440 [Naasia sp.]|uniref:3-oxo-tetronate kinase n=1 Tax=Naasia sp. TaxID=2546198 RepID=UPI0026086CBC|nr:3-oxo-tetronate kinase [Naasia sp.]MCU1570699.1 hypothetical protein [Naasia sp.]